MFTFIELNDTQIENLNRMYKRLKSMDGQYTFTNICLADLKRECEEFLAEPIIQALKSEK